MPYIPKNERIELSNGVYLPTTPGHLNFMITRLLQDYLRENGLAYSTINTIVGALDCAKMEFYRRVAVPYEEKKRVENGDLY